MAVVLLILLIVVTKCLQITSHFGILVSVLNVHFLELVNFGNGIELDVLQISISRMIRKGLKVQIEFLNWISNAYLM